MKKIALIIALILTLSICAVLSACGGSDKTTTTSTTTTTTTTSSTTSSSVNDPDIDPDPHTHEFGEWTVTTAPTCENDGEERRTCSCGEAETKTVAATGHNYKDGSCINCGAENTSGALEFVSNGDGTCYVSGIGSCTSTDIIIPSISPAGDKVTSIGKEAFYSCISLESVVIPDTVISIGAFAFERCSSLVSAEIPDSVTSVGNRAFSDCPNLRFNIYDNAKYLGNAYNQYVILMESINDDITSCEIHSNTKIIHSSAFKGCAKLNSIMIPEGVTDVGNSAFHSCTGLEGIDVPDSVINIAGYAFRGCTSLVSANIGSGVKNIGIYAFNGCTSLKNVVIPDSVTEIAYDAFSYCSSLESVIIGNGVTKIGSSAFNACMSLESITIGNSVTSISDDAFGDCGPNLSRVYISDISAWLNISFKHHWSNPCCAGADIYLNGEKLTDLVIPDGVTDIGGYAFYGCTSLESIVIPDSVTDIGEYAFYGCTSLEYNIYDNAKYLGNANNPYLVLVESINDDITSCNIHPDTKFIVGGAFASCRNLVSIQIPSFVTSIGASAFDGCYSLESIDIPDSVTSIGYEAFWACNNLKTINYNGSKSQWSDISKGSDWDIYTGSYTVYCTDGNISK